MRLALKSNIAAAALLVCLAANLGAQRSPPTDPASLLQANMQQRAAWATEWLRSYDPQRVAWGAWLARTDRQISLIPQLVQKVTEYQSLQEPGIEDDAMLAVLDALIELHAKVLVADARKLYPRFAAQSIILLVGAGSAAQQALLDIFDRTAVNAEWLAAGNVLFKYRVPGFAARLLDKFTQHVTVSILDPGSSHGGGIGGNDIGCGTRVPSPRTAWPPIAKYQLTQFPSLSMMFLVGGETPVYDYRVESDGYEDALDSPGCPHGDRDSYRAEYLAKLLYSSLMKRSDAYPDVRLEWLRAESYPAQLAAAIGERRKLFDLAVAELQEAPGALRMLTQDEAASLKPRIEIVIRDWRSDRSIPLPNVIRNDNSIAIKTEFTKPLL